MSSGTVTMDMEAYLDMVNTTEFLRGENEKLRTEKGLVVINKLDAGKIIKTEYIGKDDFIAQLHNEISDLRELVDEKNETIQGLRGDLSVLRNRRFFERVFNKWA